MRSDSDHTRDINSGWVFTAYGNQQRNIEEQEKKAQHEKQQREYMKMLEEQQSKEWPVNFIYHKKIIKGVTWFKCCFDNFPRSDDEYIEESNLSGEAIRIFDLMKKMAILTEFARWRCLDIKA